MNEDFDVAISAVLRVCATRYPSRTFSTKTIMDMMGYSFDRPEECPFLRDVSKILKGIEKSHNPRATDEEMEAWHRVAIREYARQKLQKVLSNFPLKHRILQERADRTTYVWVRIAQ